MFVERTTCVTSMHTIPRCRLTYTDINMSSRPLSLAYLSAPFLQGSSPAFNLFYTSTLLTRCCCCSSSVFASRRSSRSLCYFSIGLLIFYVFCLFVCFLSSSIFVGSQLLLPRRRARHLCPCAVSLSLSRSLSLSLPTLIRLTWGNMIS